MKIKKLISGIITLGISAAVFCGVASGCKTDDVQNEYDVLNTMLDHNYSHIVLTVTNTFSEECVLTDEYTMKFSDGVMTINYKVERFSEASLDFAVSEKTIFVGEATVTDGKVTYVQGDEVNLDAVTVATGINFKEEYFENADLTGNYLMADVKSPSGFLSSEMNCTDMKVKATFFNIFYDIKITYKAQSGDGVEYLYVFSL